MALSPGQIGNAKAKEEKKVSGTLTGSVNQKYFGDEPYGAVERALHCQIRVADLILTECLWIMVSEALEAGKLDRRFPDNPQVDVRNYVDEQKFEIGPEIHKLIVNPRT